LRLRLTTRKRTRPTGMGPVLAGPEGWVGEMSVRGGWVQNRRSWALGVWIDLPYPSC
jgi:hypothetical protein